MLICKTRVRQRPIVCAVVHELKNEYAAAQEIRRKEVDKHGRRRRRLFSAAAPPPPLLVASAVIVLRQRLGCRDRASGDPRASAPFKAALRERMRGGVSI